MTRAVVAVVIALALTGCADDLQACGTTFTSVGLFNYDEVEPGVKMKIIPGNVVWSILLVESVAFPIYFVGFSLFEPVAVDCKVWEASR